MVPIAHAEIPRTKSYVLLPRYRAREGNVIIGAYTFAPILIVLFVSDGNINYSFMFKSLRVAGIEHKDYFFTLSPFS